MLKKVILLTGGTGFIGRNIRESYLSQKHIILSPNSKELNLLDEQSVADFFNTNTVDMVIHTAISRCNRDNYNQEDLLKNNLQMFFNLEYYKNKYNKFLHLGSGAVYDMRRSIVKVQEEAFLKQIPQDMYGFSKYVISKYIKEQPQFYDLRLFGIFGKYEDFTMRLISNQICKILFNKQLSLNQNRIFDYLYVDDLISILDFFIENEPAERFFNLTPDHSVSLIDITQKIQDIMHTKLPVQVKEAGLGLEYTGDNSKLKKIIPELQFTPIDKAIEELIDWYSNNKNIISL